MKLIKSKKAWAVEIFMVIFVLFLVITVVIQKFKQNTTFEDIGQGALEVIELYQEAEKDLIALDQEAKIKSRKVFFALIKDNRFNEISPCAISSKIIEENEQINVWDFSKQGCTQEIKTIFKDLLKNEFKEEVNIYIKESNIIGIFDKPKTIKEGESSYTYQRAFNIKLS